ncbi:MAG: EndoU domain-containing protein [Actinomycetota bacterium]|nr:EndoU domain-containing protein [Actinomycetota bacterium]
MATGEATDRLARQTQRLSDLIDEKGALWDDEGGRATLQRYLRPHAEAARELVAALRERDGLLVAFEAEMAVVERELDLAADAHVRTEAAVARAKEDIQSADEQLAEIFKAEAATAELEARAVRFADLANACLGGFGPAPTLEPPQRRKERTAVLERLKRAYPALDVEHILDGELTQKSEHKYKFVGFHSRRSQIGVIRTRQRSRRGGVYEATVAGLTPDGRRIPKKSYNHTMFPDDWSGDKICREVLFAYLHKHHGVSETGRWRGLSKCGVPISGHLRDDNLIIGHPVIREEENVDNGNSFRNGARPS